jgi:hypothetical protein
MTILVSGNMVELLLAAVAGAFLMMCEHQVPCSISPVLIASLHCAGC